MEVGNRQIELVLLEKNQKKKKRDEKGLLSVLVRCSASASAMEERRWAGRVAGLSPVGCSASS